MKRSPVLFTLMRRLKTCFLDLPWTVLAELAFLRTSLKRLNGMDVLVVPGSGPLTDWWGGPWRHPYSQLSWAFLARITGARYIALSIGCERLTSRLGKSFCKWFLSLANYRSFRDPYSRDSMRAIGFKGNATVYPDQGFALADLMIPNHTCMSPRPCQENHPGLIVGISPVGQPSCVADGGIDPSYNRYVDILSSFVVWLVQRGHRLVFCPTDCVQD